MTVLLCFGRSLLQTDTGRMVWDRSTGDRVLLNGTKIGLAALSGYAGYLIYNWIYPQK